VGSVPHDVAALILNSLISDSGTIKSDIQLLLTFEDMASGGTCQNVAWRCIPWSWLSLYFSTPSFQGFPMSFITQKVNYSPLVDMYGGTNRRPVEQTVPVEFKGMYVCFGHVVTA
jgi:hypothetical protein